ncbi:MAG TPA: ATP-binding protein, partial [Polyangiales bacterium]|nr:ATP-binding protein [Polyangiales bacterium]
SGLELDDVVQLLADALRAPPQHVLPLARLVREKTAGNPFFVLQFVAALAEQGLLTFDSASASWQWELARIRALAISDNVAELMAEKLSRLAPETQQALAQLACLGAIAEVSTVAYVSARSELELHATLGPAVRAGVISRAHGRYAFLHDRIQEAAYVLIPVPEQALHHLRLGRALALQAQAQELEPEIHPVVDQFNRGASLITSSEERVRVAQLNLRAGKRALAASAYSSASGYLAAGRELLPDEPWQTHYRLCFELELNRAHCEFLLGAHAVATELLVELSERATSAADLTAVASLRMLLCTTLDRVDEAIEVGLSCLGRAGITWSAHPDAKLVERELETLWQLLAGRPVEALIDLPRMRDPDWLATMEILDALIVPALFSDVQLVDLVLLRMTNLSIEHGNSDAGCNAYAALNIVLGFRAGEYQTAFRFGRLACELVDKRGMNRFEARVYVSFSNFVVPWTMPISGMRAVVSRGIAGAHALGDPTLAIYGLRALVSAQLRAGEPLAEVQRELEEALALTRKTSFALGVHSCLEQLILVRGLRGLSIDDLHEGGVPEGTRWFERQLEAGGERLAFAASWYWIHRIQSCFFAEDFTGALEAMPLAERLLPLTRAFMEVSDYHLYSALTHAASCDTTADSTREQHLTALLAHHTQLAIWGEKCPANFASCAALVAAEFARVNGDERQAERLYDEAMHAAQQRGAIHEEALACELAARFHRLRGFDLIADAYRSRARHCYARWGADGKVRQLDQSHRPGASPSSALAPGDTVDEPVEQWEVAAIFKAAQALSSEIELRSLIETLIRMAVEHAGAERGVLILLRLNEPLVAARAAMHQGRLEIALCESQVSGTDLPSSALNYVLRTRKRLILDDASLGDQLAGDAYVAQRQVRSVLCIPIIKQSVLVGMLYLENNLTAGAFTPRRITVLEFLASQAAISLDNAYLYADLARSEALLSEGQRVSHTGTWSWSPRDGKAVWSDELQRIFGYDPQQSPAGSVGAFIERIHPDDRTAVMQTVASIAREHAVHASDFRALLPDGSVKYLHAVGRPMRDEAGQVQSYIGSTMDITERKQSEDALRDARANLVHTSRLTTMGELAASIAHEVNQPLTAIVSNANSCLRFLSTDPPEVLRGIHAAERVVRDGLYAGEVIKRIRDVLRKAPRQLSAIDLNEVIRDVLDLIRSELHRHDVSLELELADGLAPVLVDRVQLQQVIANLAINAIEAMSERQSSSRILHVMTALERKGYAVARVRDSGAGVAVEQLDRIFDAFFSTKRDGLGMGLAVCRSIVEAHGGRLWASQSELHGATLQFTLPLAGS